MNLSRKISVIVTFSVLIVSLLSLLVYYQYSKQELLSSALADLRGDTSTTIDHYENFLHLVSPSLQSLSRLLRNELAEPATWQATSFDSKMSLSNDGAWRNTRNQFDGAQQAGLFLPADTALTEQTKLFYNTALTVFDGFGFSATSNPVFTNIWMLGHDRSEIIFDREFPDFIYEMSADTDYTDSLWMTLASPSENPQRRLTWTPALFDSVSKEWMISALYPLDIDGKWIATLGIDVSLDKVFSLLYTQDDLYENEQYFLIDHADQFILAGAWQQQLQANNNLFELGDEEQQFAELLYHDLKSQRQILSPVYSQGIEYQVIASVIAPNNWRYYRLIPTSEILKPLQKNMINASMFILLTIILLGVFIDSAVRKMVVKPLLAIVERSRNYALGETPMPVELDNTTELVQLNKALQSMHNELTKDAQRLIASEQRYRQVVSNINEVIVQIDQNKKWQFLSPVWQELSGFSIEDTLYKPVAEFLSPIDSEYVTHVLDLLFSGEQDAWEGDLRLKCSDERFIWVKLSLHMNEESTNSEQNIYGTIENIHINRITRDINKLIRSAEQKVLISNVKTSTLLEFVTNELLYILDISSVWVKVCVDKQSQILSHTGEVSGFLFDNDTTWPGLHDEYGPVIKCVQEHSAVRVKSDSELPAEWRQRLDYDGISDSLFLPFYIGGDTQAVLGFHMIETEVFTEELQLVLLHFSEGLRLICKMVDDQNLMRLHRAAVEKTANAITIFNASGYIEWVNAAFVRQTLFKAEEVIGKKPRILEPKTTEKKRVADELWQQLKSGKVWSGELTDKRKDGETITVYQTVTPLADDLGEITHYVAVSEDITERKTAQQRITFMATHDELTSLPNRNLLNDRLQQAIEHAKRQASRMAVLFIDIDHFKYINDSLGHQIGDDLLQILSARLSAILRKEDTVARFGGDEFVVVLSGISEINYVKSIASNLLDEIKAPYHIMDHELLITGSIGISIYPDDAKDSDILIQQADSAMYLAKEQGRNNSQFYTKEINEKITRRLILEKALRQAVEQQQFIVFYQPKVNLMTNRITGMEALVRWQHPELGLISPVEFIPLAEETGIILDIGSWVMETACKQMKIWESSHPELINMSINVSARQFWQDDFVEQVENVLEKTGVSPDHIEFELTETVVLNEIEPAIATMLKLKKVGISLSIDDFGTGYSSLNYLKQLPVDILKIDRTFISNLGHNDSDSAIVRSILSLAENFQLQVVAEGIETSEQQHILTSLGCHYGQGYYFCVPMNADDVTVHVDEQRDTQYSLWEEPKINST